MTTEQLLLFAILGVSLALFAWGRLRYDLVAMLALLAAVILGVVPAEDAFSGFGHPAVITVAAILILSRALRNSSLVDLAVRLLGALGARPTVQVLGLAAITAVFSAFMNNVGALALMLPVALAVAGEARRPASEVLMPISFASLLGGLATLIGTPPNIVIASSRASVTGEPFRMFDFTPVGMSICVVGVLYVALSGWRLLPKRTEAQSTQRPLVAIEDYVTEVRLPAGSGFVGRRISDIENLGQADLSVLALVRGDDRILAPSGFIRLTAGDILILEADAAALQLVLDKAELELVGAADISASDLRSDRVSLVEAVVVPGSRMEGRTARSMRLQTRFALNLLALARQGEEQHERLGQVRFAPGDVLLLQGERESMPEALAGLGCLPLAGRDLQLRRRVGGSPWSLLIFLAAIATVVAGLLPPQIAFVAAAIGTIAVGDVNLRELYEAIEWPIIVLLGALIPVGLALETTGGSQTVALPLLQLAGYAPDWVVLAVLMIVTMLLSDIMNNAATAVLMAPIGITVAQGLGASVDPFLMAVAIGASSTFLTPIGHQSNLLVMGPGGYRFGDYWRMGLPLDLLIVLVGVPAILLFWPL